MSNKLTYEDWEDEKVADILKHHPDYFDILKWACQEYKDDLVYACSFGAEGIVLIDLIHKINPKSRIVFLDTGLHFPETYELIDKVKKRYPSMNIDMVKPKMSLEDQARWYGEELWQDNPNLCCHLRKIVPLQEVLSEAKAWISGLRREQSITRSQTQYINKDEKFHKIKICPLIHWTWQDVQTYIELNQLPYNSLHDKSYPSIGCYPCTQPAASESDSRAGRWAGHAKNECGLHYN